MKSKAEIVVETLRYYNLKNRGYNAEDEHCTYLDKSTGNKCAVGRCILDSELEKVTAYEEEHIKECGGSPGTNSLVTQFTDFDSLLIPEYRGHSEEFWADLQYIHDSSHMWTEDGFDTWESNIDFIYTSFGKEVGEAVKAAFAE